MKQSPPVTPDEPFEVFHPDPIRRVERAIEDLREGRMVVLVDDEDRENEGDLVIAAEKVTPEAVAFMAINARGLICLTLTRDQVNRLGLPPMAPQNQSPYNTAFTVSIEAREGVSTGISAADRARTVRVAIDPRSTRGDIVMPGHMFPLCARDGGVLERVGQTEGSVDLARLAGLLPAGVICEVMKDDGTMARMPDLEAFGRRHRIRIVAVADVIKYRMRNERIVRRVSTGTMDIPGMGAWNVALYRALVSDGLHMALWKGRLGPEPTLCRVQAAPPAWAALNASVNPFSQEANLARGIVQAEGRGVVVFMHLDGYCLDRIECFFRRDFEQDAEALPTQRSDEALRDLGTGCQILRDLGLERLRLITSSVRALSGIDAYGLHIVERVPLVGLREG